MVHKPRTATFGKMNLFVPMCFMELFLVPGVLDPQQSSIFFRPRCLAGGPESHGYCMGEMLRGGEKASVSQWCLMGFVPYLLNVFLALTFMGFIPFTRMSQSFGVVFSTKVHGGYRVLRCFMVFMVQRVEESTCFRSLEARRSEARG